jgi:hypothetical protein
MSNEKAARTGHTDYEFTAPRWFDFNNFQDAEHEEANADRWFETSAVKGNTEHSEIDSKQSQQ